MTDLGSLHCPNCGAPAGVGDLSCQYCHAALATVSCPSCFALMFASAAYCPSCGARRSRTADPARTASCAGCAGVMHEVQLGPTVLMECASCQGLWVDTKTFDEICASQETQGAVLQQYGAPPPPRTAPPVRYRPCVACGKMMNRLNFGKVSGTVIDVCKGHGTFLDAGELHAIVIFLRQGGLDRARQRQIEELKEAEERLRGLQQAQGRRPAEIHIERSARTWTGVDLITLLEKLSRD